MEVLNEFHKVPEYRERAHPSMPLRFPLVLAANASRRIGLSSSRKDLKSNLIYLGTFQPISLRLSSLNIISRNQNYTRRFHVEDTPSRRVSYLPAASRRHQGRRATALDENGNATGVAIGRDPRLGSTHTATRKRFLRP